MPGLILAVAVTLGLWLALSYKRLMGLRNELPTEWRQVDLQLKRRHDLVPNLLNAVRGSPGAERDALSSVMDARASALTATGPSDAAQKESQLTRALGRLVAAAESESSLNAIDTVGTLLQELAATESKIDVARQSYNDAATRFNTAQQTFPTSVFASVAGFRRAELFAITDAAESSAHRSDAGRSA